MHTGHAMSVHVTWHTILLLKYVLPLCPLVHTGHVMYPHVPHYFQAAFETLMHPALHHAPRGLSLTHYLTIHAWWIVFYANLKICHVHYSTPAFILYNVFYLFMCWFLECGVDNMSELLVTEERRSCQSDAVFSWILSKRSASPEARYSVQKKMLVVSDLRNVQGREIT